MRAAREMERTAVSAKSGRSRSQKSVRAPVIGPTASQSSSGISLHLMSRADAMTKAVEQMQALRSQDKKEKAMGHPS